MLSREESLVKELNKIGIELSPLQQRQMIQYYEILVEWNKVMNLTTIVNFEEALSKHFVDSLLIASKFDLKKEYSIIDVGTGAGFPGIPMKIAFPDLKITLLDSLNKRIKFLNHVITELKLENIEAIHGRAEEIVRKEEHWESYDFCVSRAVANLTSLSELCIPFIKVKGHFIAYKSSKADEEMKEAAYAIRVLGAKIITAHKFKLMENEGQLDRCIVDIEKTISTNPKYPRAGGKPINDPLKEKQSK